MSRITSSTYNNRDEYTLTAEEYEALTEMSEFQASLKAVRRRKEKEAAAREAARPKKDPKTGLFEHKSPGMNPYREDGLYGKAAAAADGDWYSSH